MDYEYLSNIIVDCLGGRENIVSFMHCLTRIRFELCDINKADSMRIKELKGVYGIVIGSGRYQIVTGTNTPRFYNFLCNIIDSDERSDGSLNRKFIINVLKKLAFTTAAVGVLILIFKLLKIDFEFIYNAAKAVRVKTVLSALTIFSVLIVIVAAVVRRMNDSNKTSDKNISFAVGLSTDIFAPIKGKTIPLLTENGSKQSEAIFCEGAAIIPEDNLIVAPCTGRITDVAKSRQSVTLVSEKGAEIMINIGGDTVFPQGKYFEVYAEVGDNIKMGEPLIEFQTDKLKKEGYDLTVSVAVLNFRKYDRIETVAEFASEQKPFLKLYKIMKKKP